MGLIKWILPLALSSSSLAFAQGPWELDVYGVTSGDGDIERGGEYSDDQYGLKLGYGHSFGRGRIAGFSVAVDQRKFDFSGLENTSVVPDLDDRDNYEVSLFGVHPLTREWGLLVSTGAKWSTADGGHSSDGFSYSAISLASYRGFDDLTLGFGVAYVNDVVDVKTVPIVTIDWQINDKWRLSNPFEAGFNGRAGLELSYQHNAKVNFGVGGGYRSEQFAYDGGEIEQELPLTFARVSYDVRPELELTFATGYRLKGDLTTHVAGEEIDTEIDGRWFAAVLMRFGS